MIKKLFLCVFLLGILFSQAFDFSAEQQKIGNVDTGVVSYKGAVIMRLYTQGDFPTAFARAQMAAYRLNANIGSLEEVRDIVFSYNENLYTAYLNGKKLVSVYPEEVNINKSTPEGVMSNWVNNLKNEMLKNVQNTENKLLDEESLPVDNYFEASNSEKYEANSENFKRVIVLLEDLKKNSRNNLLGGLVLLNFLMLLIIITVFFILVKIKEQVGSIGDLEKTEKLEEMENTVSLLIKELRDTSEEVTHKIRDKAQLLEAEQTFKNDNNLIDVSVGGESKKPAPEMPELKIEKPQVKELADQIESVIAPKPKTAAEKLADTLELDELEEITPELEVSQSHDAKYSYLMLLEDEYSQVIESLGAEVQDMIEKIFIDEDITKNEKIVRLTELKIDKAIIAKILSVGIGEIEIVLKLSKA